MPPSVLHKLNQIFIDFLWVERENMVYRRRWPWNTELEDMEKTLHMEFFWQFLYGGSL